MKRQNRLCRIMAAILSACLLTGMLALPVAGETPPTEIERYIGDLLCRWTTGYDEMEILKCRTDVTTITIPSKLNGFTVVSISDHIFEGCTELTSITISFWMDCSGISADAFYDCPKLKDVYYNGSPQEWKSFVIGDWSLSSSAATIHYQSSILMYDDFCYEMDNGFVTITDYANGTAANVVIPETIEGYPVTRIGQNAFYRCTALVTIEIPDCVTDIGRSAFVDCTNLKSIRIPDGVQKISGWTFGNCTFLTSVTIPDSVTVIEDGVFYGCVCLESIRIPDGVTKIGPQAFKDCALRTVHIPEGVTKIEADTFYGCSILTTIHIPDGVTSIGEHAFAGCSSLTALSIPNSVKTIENHAFAGCESLPSIVIPDGVISIAYCAFSRCRALSSVTIPNSVKSIGFEAFVGCSSLRAIYIPTSVTSIDTEAFFNCVNLNDVYYEGTPEDWEQIEIWESNDAFTAAAIHFHSGFNLSYEIADGEVTVTGCADTNAASIMIPDTIEGCPVTAIARRAFAEFEALSAISIPDSVTDIAPCAFEGCKALTDVFLPKNLESITESLFYGCEQLQTVTIPTSVTSIGGSAFADCPKLTLKYAGTEGQFAQIDLSEDALPHAAIQYLATSMAGDVDGSGRLDIGDVILVNRYLAEDTEIVITETGLRAADCNGDGVLSVGDSTWMLRKIAGY